MTGFNRTVDYIKKRMDSINDDEEQAYKDYGEGQTFSSNDVIQELQWVLDTITKV